MGAIAGLTGLAGGASGTGFSGPQQAGITNPTTADQVQGAYSGTQGALTGQQGLLAALQAQNGLQNQSQVYGQLQGIASGAVNPAQAQFNQNTSANVANQAALMAGQRGASANVGLMARQAAQQGAATQQQAVGQEATQQANNQINAIGQAGQLATTQAGQQIGQTNANVQAQQAEQANLLNAQQGFNTSTVASQGNVNTANAGLAQTQMTGQQALIGGLMNGAGAAAGSGGGGGGAASTAAMAAAGGGEIEKMAGGGDTSPAVTTPGVYSGTQGPVSGFGQFLKGATGNNQPASTAQQPMPTNGPQALQTGASNLVKALSSPSQNSPDASVTSTANVSDFAQGGMVKCLLSPGEIKLTPDEVQMVMSGRVSPMEVGEKVKGTPKVKGDKNSYANDTVEDRVPEHTIIVPRSETQSSDPDKNSKQFVKNVIAKKRARK